MLLQKKFGRGEKIRKTRYFVGLFIILLFLTTGCVVTEVSEERISDIEYTVIDEAELPNEIEELVAENLKNKMKLSYTDQGDTYIIRGYGAQDTSGYSIEIVEIYETETTVVVSTNLLGPRQDENIQTVETYPYIVIKIEEYGKPIVFEPMY